MQKEWFELQDYIRQKADKQVWVPLRCSRSLIKEGELGYQGFKEEYFGLTSILIKKQDIEKAKELEWIDVGLLRSHKGNPYEEEYQPASHFEHNGIVGEHLVISHEIGGDYCNNWHISPDLLTTLELVQEGGSWLAYNRGHEEVIKLHKNNKGCVDEILIRLSYLKDYLCVRKRVLMLSSYRSRVEIADSELGVDWELEKITTIEKGLRWGGRMYPIHEGSSHRYGEKMAILHVGRTNIDFDNDVPEYPFSSNEENTKSKSWTSGFDGRKLFRIEGEVWKSDFVFPSQKSSIILDDEDTTDEYSYITKADGSKESAKKLIDSGKYLWFKPYVVNSILSNRDTTLSWYTRDTGSVGFNRHGLVHFGVNKIGIITVYAKDICLLPDWQQKIWHSYNISPDGKVSAELLMSQQEAQPASTLPPEEFFKSELEKLNDNFKRLYNEKLIKNDNINEILKNIHRFVAVPKNGLFVLAKDITRVTADTFNRVLLKKILGNKKGYKKLGTLLLMRKLISTKVSEDIAEEIMTALDASYLLRINDAHIPSTEKTEEALIALKITSEMSNIEKGRILIHECTSCLATINNILNEQKFKSKK
ncbi:MAG: hypothetical protein U5L10_02760 [Candidatus Moranbacteria bacterium]|nr:hypothetical protein [Candidatus Moranbacteria bacterium]